jgi:hypothetical protein
MLQNKTRTLFFSDWSSAPKTTCEYGQHPQTHRLVFSEIKLTEEKTFFNTYE